MARGSSSRPSKPRWRTCRGLASIGMVMWCASRSACRSTPLQRKHCWSGAWPTRASALEARIEAAASAPHETWMDAHPYPGTCRGRFGSIAEARESSGREPALRFAIPDGLEAMPFDDAYRGRESGPIAGDFVIQKRDRGPAYQLAVVLDDAAFSISEVLRGDDLLASTPRQLLLYQAFGKQPPEFAPLPLVVGSDGRRLAKRHGDTSLAHFRQQGVQFRPSARIPRVRQWAATGVAALPGGRGSRSMGGSRGRAPDAGAEATVGRRPAGVSSLAGLPASEGFLLARASCWRVLSPNRATLRGARGSLPPRY